MALPDELVVWGERNKPRARRMAKNYACGMGTPPRVAEERAEQAVDDAECEIIAFNTRQPQEIATEAHYSNTLNKRAVNRMIDIHRKAKRERRDWTEDLLSQLADVLGVSAEARAIGNETNARVRAAIASLPVEQQRGLELYFWDDLTLHQVAQELGLPFTTFYPRHRDALERLRVALSDLDPNPVQPSPAH